MDTECREERLHKGRKLPAAGYDERVFGNFLNQTGLGLEFIVRTLKRYDLKGVFFVDPMGAYSFGKQGLSDVIHYLRKNNQDIQIHLHPIQKTAYWHSNKENPANDFMSHYSQTQQYELIEEAKNLLYEAGVPADTLNCLRAGHYSADDKLYKAMYKARVFSASNYNVDYIQKGICKLKLRQSNHNIARKNDDGVTEYPVTNIQSSNGSRHCQVTALSFWEMKEALEKAEKNGVEDFVIVTHSFEFLFEGSNGRGYKNHINRWRFLLLCRYLSRYKQKYSVSVFNSEEFQKNQAIDECLYTSKYSRYMRLLEQGIKNIQRKIIGIIT